MTDKQIITTLKLNQVEVCHVDSALALYRAYLRDRFNKAKRKDDARYMEIFQRDMQEVTAIIRRLDGEITKMTGIAIHDEEEMK